MRACLLGLATVCLLSYGAGASARTVPSGCKMAGAQTVAATATARAFTKGDSLYGCLYSAPRLQRLTGFGTTDLERAVIANVTINGRFVAWGRSVAGKGGYDDHVTVYDLRRRRVASFSTTGAPPPSSIGATVEGEVRGVGPTTAIRLRATGHVAWIAQDRFTPGPPRYEVHKREGASRTLLAQGTDVEPRSLGLSSNVLSWRQAGVRHRATLGPRPSGPAA